MNRREFLAAGVGGAVSVTALPSGKVRAAPLAQGRALGPGVRDLFPRLGEEVFLDAAAGTPLSTFTEDGLRRYEELWRHGPGTGRADYFAEMMSEIRGLFGRMIGAKESEIGLVHCTKAGEQIVLDGLPAIRRGGNIVTNDMHFTGSLHNLYGLKQAGLDVRIVKSDDWDVTLEAMDASIDDDTALVTITLVSNINGRIERLPALAEMAHRRGAYVFADIIQAAGITPFDVRALGIDFAACSGYKWLLGPHGAGFFYAREELQGDGLPDRLFPGHVTHNYAPWTDTPDPATGDYTYRAPIDARRYQPGHVSYLGYCGLYEGLKFLNEIGVEAAQQHSIGLAQRLAGRLDPDRYRSISRHLSQSPIATFRTPNAPALEDRLRAAKLVITLQPEQIRVSPAVYNTEDDIDSLVDVLNA